MLLCILLASGEKIAFMTQSHPADLGIDMPSN